MKNINHTRSSISDDIRNILCSSANMRRAIPLILRLLMNQVNLSTNLASHFFDLVIGKILTSRLSLSKHLAHNLGNLLLLGKIGVFHNRRNASSRLLLLISKHTLFRSLIFAAEGLTKRSAVGFLLRSLIMFQTFISRHNSNFFSDKLVLTSVTPASSAPVLQTPKATSSTLYFDSLTV